MPSIIVRKRDGASRVLNAAPFSYEDVLQRNISELLNLIPLQTVSDEAVSHLTIGVEWPAGSGAADVVLIGSDGILTIVETKLKKNPQARREVIAQLLEYAAYLSEWTIWEVIRRAEEFFQTDKAFPDHRGKTVNEVLRLFLEDTDEAVESFKGKVEHNLRQGRIRLIVAVDEVSEQAQKIITFVNSYSAFDIYLLQISAYTDELDRQIFVPALYGYARKVPTTPETIQWNWDKYEDELGWSKAEVDTARLLHQRLEEVSARWAPETRFNRGWTTIYCGGKAVFGVQRFKRYGVQYWFRLDAAPDMTFPPGVTTRAGKGYFYLGSNPGQLADETLQTVCELSLATVGVSVGAAIP